MNAISASEVLHKLIAAGLSVALTPDAGLKVTPARALTDDLRNTIKMHKAVLVEYLQRDVANTLSDADQELIEERSAIMEYDGGMERTQAERLALLHTRYLLHHWGCRTCCAAGQVRGQRCATGSALWQAYDLEAFS